MFKLFRAFWYKIAGWFGKKTEGLQEDQHVMAATFDAAIEKSDQRYKDTQSAIADLITIVEERKVQIKEIGERIKTLHQIQDGAQAKMQSRIDSLKKSGKGKEDILADADFIKHKTAYEDASTKLAEKQGDFDKKEESLKEKQTSLASHKAKLQQMQRGNKDLKEEKQEAIADINAAKHEEALNSRLLGVGGADTTENDLAQARAARNRVVNRAKVSSELAGNDASVAENEYLTEATKTKTSSSLDKLLDWGETDKKEEPKEEALNPAKLPE